MNNKNIIIAGAIAIGLYLFSQTKKIQYTTAAQKVAQRTRSTATPTVRQRTAQKISQRIAQKVAQKVAQKRIAKSTNRAAYIAAAQKAAAQRAWIEHARKIKAEKAAAPWKAPLIWSPKPKFRVITPSDILQKLAKKDIIRKKALQQKTTQKTTYITPTDRRKKRLKALYGSHWHDIWIQREKR